MSKTTCWLSLLFSRFVSPCENVCNYSMLWMAETRYFPKSSLASVFSASKLRRSIKWKKEHYFEAIFWKAISAQTPSTISLSVVFYVLYRSKSTDSCHLLFKASHQVLKSCRRVVLSSQMINLLYYPILEGLCLLLGALQISFNVVDLDRQPIDSIFTRLEPLNKFFLALGSLSSDALSAVFIQPFSPLNSSFGPPTASYPLH